MEETIAYTSPFVPPEWIEAHGFRPRRVIPGTAAGGDAPAGACSFAEAFRAETAGNYRAVVFATTCDQMRRAREEAKGETFLLNVPHTTTPAARDLYASELVRLGRALVRMGGRAPGKAELIAVLRRHDEERSRRRDTFRAPADGVPIALVGVPVFGPGRTVYDVIREAGGAVVLDGSETGERALPAPFDADRLEEAPFETLVETYFDTLPDAFRRPDTLLHDWLARGIEERGAKGILFLRCTWCDLWNAEEARVRETFDLPVVSLDVAGEMGSRSRLETRVQALLDMAR